MKSVLTTVLFLLLATSSFSAEDEGSKFLQVLQSKQDPNLESFIFKVELNTKFKSFADFCKFTSEMDTQKAKALIPGASDCSKEDSKNKSPKGPHNLKLSLNYAELSKNEETNGHPIQGDAEINSTYYSFFNGFLEKVKAAGGSIQAGWKVEARPSLGMRATEAVIGETIESSQSRPLEKIKIPENREGEN